MPQFVASRDGTSIAYDVIGTGPALVVLGGAFNTRMSPHPLVDLLSETFTVYTADRRGRGDSGGDRPDPATPRDSVQREIEDVAAVITAAGGSAMLYGHSSGAILALETAASGHPVTALAVYEPPYTAQAPVGVTESRSGGATESGSGGAGVSVQDALDAGDDARAARAFLRLTGLDEPTLDWMSTAPFWPGMVAVAQSLTFDLALTGDGHIPVERLSAVAVPTLVLSGGTSADWAGEAAAGVTAAIPASVRRTVAGQNHGVDQTVLAPILVEFFSRFR